MADVGVLGQSDCVHFAAEDGILVVDVEQRHRHLGRRRQRRDSGVVRYHRHVELDGRFVVQSLLIRYDACIYQVGYCLRSFIDMILCCRDLTVTRISWSVVVFNLLFYNWK